MTLADQVLTTVAALVPEAGTLVVAVSGGPDSVALLKLLRGGPYALHIGHFDHALRAESADDAAFVAELGESLGVPVHIARAEVARVAAAKGWNLEDAARRLRYGHLTRLTKRVGADALLTGHTLDDQAETVLMQLLRGAAFLKGMAPRRGRVVRPLLGQGRAALLAYLRDQGQPYLEDVSNRDTRLTRAWLRAEILPGLGARYPRIRRTLARLAEGQRAQAEHFDALVAPLLDDVDDGLDALRLAARDAATQRHALARLLQEAGLAPDWEGLERLRAQLGREHPTRLSLPRGYEARLAYGRLRVQAPGGGPAPGESGVHPATDPLPPELDAEALQGFPDLVFRSRRPGDRIRLAGGSKSVSDLLIDRKVPREARGGLRVLASGSEVLWVEGPGGEGLAADVRVARPQEDPDLPWMRLALEGAQGAFARGEVPVGAVVVKDGKLVGAASNLTETARDPTAHAEMLALRQAAEALGDWRLGGCTLYVSLEPCAMCYGAMLQAQLSRLVYGADNRREGAAGTVLDLADYGLKHRLERRSGVLAKEASALLSRFFQSRRAED